MRADIAWRRLGDLDTARQVAAGQHGVITLGQFRSCGVSDRQVSALCRSGWIVPVRRGAFAFAGALRSQWEQAVAVVLVAGPGAILSHSTAGAIQRLPCLPRYDRVEITVPSERQPRLSGVDVHRMPRIDPSDIEERAGVRVTTAARTLVDLAPRFATAALAKMIDEGSIGRLWTAQQLFDTSLRAGTRGDRCGSHLRQLLEERLRDPRAESALEQQIISWLAPFGPFEVQFQVVLEGQVFLLDIAWPRFHVAVETDGWSVRSRSRSKFDHDRRKANLLAANGWTVAHVTSAMDREEVIGAVARLLPGWVSEQSIGLRRRG